MDEKQTIPPEAATAVDISDVLESLGQQNAEQAVTIAKLNALIKALQTKEKALLAKIEQLSKDNTKPRPTRRRARTKQ